MPQPPWLNSLEREGREREREQGMQDFIVPSDGLSDKVSNKKSSKSWSQRSQEIYEAWEQVMREYFEAFVSSNGFKVSHCYTCRCSLSTFYIHCNQCIQDFCSECDILEHQRHPFHHRILNKPNPLETKVLGQMEFVNDSGSIKHMSKGFMSTVYYSFSFKSSCWYYFIQKLPSLVACRLNVVLKIVAKKEPTGWSLEMIFWRSSPKTVKWMANCFYLNF